MPKSLTDHAPWWGFALLLLVLPMLFSSNFALSLLSQMGIAIVACLSYNILLGQGGMLSFGHAVYTGLGGYIAIHAMNLAAAKVLPIPVSLMPLVGGLGGLFFAVLFGYVSTRKSGTTFAMITLGFAELVSAMSLMLADFFGGEAGVSGNRVMGEAFMGITFGPQRQVYYLIAVYTFVCVALIYAFTQTPLGRILNAVRDNAERVEFIGYNTQRVRYFAFIIAGFFAGIAGGLAAVNNEIVTAENVGTGRSGAYLLFTFLGGTGLFYGPIIGGVLLILAYVLFSEFTKAWLLYLGLTFLLMVMYAPGGIASLLHANWRVIQHGLFKPLLPSYLGLLLAALLILLGLGAMIEMVYHLQLQITVDGAMTFLGMPLQALEPMTWIGCLSAVALGVVVWRPCQQRFTELWNHAQTVMAQAELVHSDAPKEAA
jgi:branched-chain amino acid transport system permease protein